MTATRATFTESDLHRAAFYQPESVALVREALRSDRVLDLGRDAGGAGRYTTRDYLDAEARLLAAAEKLASRDRFRLDPAVVVSPPAPDEHEAHRRAAGGFDATARDAAALATASSDLSGGDLAARQRAAVLHATTAADLAQIAGGDRAGRAEAARAIAAAYREHGDEVRGAALTAKGASALAAATGVRSRTLATLESSWAEGSGRLHARSVLLLEEAGLLDVRRLGGILAEAEERGAKVVLLGDPGRLQAIGAGDAYRGLLEQHPSACLDPGSARLPAPAVPAGSPVPAILDRCEGAGRLHWSGGHAGVQAELLAAYARDRLQEPACGRLILAGSQDAATQLNAAVRAERQAAGELGPGIRAGSVELAAGDRVVFRRDDQEGLHVVDLDAAGGGVRRGALGTVVVAEPRRITVRLDDGRGVAFDPARYRSVAHGYAVSVHGAKDLPVDRVYVLADPRMNRHAAETALSRHRHGLDLFADRETFPSREHLDKVLSRPGPKDLAGDYAAAELRRAVRRLQDIAAKTAGVTREEQRLGKALAAHADLQRARLRVVDARRGLGAPAAQAYVDPAKALRDLLGDPAAADRLREGKARAYGNLRGHAVLGAASRARDEAHQAVMTLTGRLYAYQRSLTQLRAAKQTFRAQVQELARPGGPPLVPATGSASRGELPGVAAAHSPSTGLPRPAEIRRELAGVTATLRTYQQASHSAQDAVEAAVRRLGPAAADSALLLLPAEAALPVQLAVRAVERAVERGFGLGLDLVLGR